MVRAGFGMFYDRFALANTLAATRFNGENQQQYVITNPDFFPVVPSPSSLGVAATAQSVERISSTLRAPVPDAVGHHRGAPTAREHHHCGHLHERAWPTPVPLDDINAPLPGTYDAAVPGSGVFPLSGKGRSC